MAVTLRQMHYFVSLAEAGSFGQAARDIPISQPALSTQIRDLELDLDVRLVERLPRGVRLTQAGEEMLTHMRRILIEVQDLQNLSASYGALRGVLKLGVIPTIAPYLLPPVLTALEGSDLKLQVRIREAQTDQLMTE